MHDHVGLARLGEHRVHVHAARLRQRAGDVSADGVRGLGQEAERRTRVCAISCASAWICENTLCWVA
jgi:hypothetical protein